MQKNYMQKNNGRENTKPENLNRYYLCQQMQEKYICEKVPGYFLQMTDDSTYLITIDLDRAYIGGTNSTHREETMIPCSCVHGSLIEVKQTLNPACNARVDTQKFPCNWQCLLTVHLHVHSSAKAGYFG